jgi:lactoylglutathione lyase
MDRMITEGFPILTTPDLARALAFYRDVLGGEVTYAFPPEGEPGYVALAIGSFHLGVGHNPETAEGPDGQRVALWLYVEDCDAAVEHLRAAGTTITQEPIDQPWGERVARALDPDGNEVHLGQAAPTEG